MRAPDVHEGRLSAGGKHAATVGIHLLIVREVDLAELLLRRLQGHLVGVLSVNGQESVAKLLVTQQVVPVLVEDAVERPDKVQGDRRVEELGQSRLDLLRRD